MIIEDYSRPLMFAFALEVEFEFKYQRPACEALSQFPPTLKQEPLDQRREDPPEAPATETPGKQPALPRPGGYRGDSIINHGAKDVYP